MTTVPDYMAQAARHESDPGYRMHMVNHLTLVAHRLICPSCFALLCGGSTASDEEQNRAIDAQIDMLIAAYGGSSRVALMCAVQALGRAAALLGATAHRDMP